MFLFFRQDLFKVLIHMGLLLFFFALPAKPAKAADANNRKEALEKELALLSQIEKGDVVQKKNQLLALKTSFAEQDDPTLKSRYFLLLARAYIELSQLDSAIIFIEKVTPVISPEADKQLQFEYHNNIGRYLYNIQMTDSALAHFNQCIKLSAAMGDTRQLAMSYNNLGIMYDGKGEYRKAYEQYFEAMKRFEEINDEQQLAITLNNMGVIMENLKEYDKAIEYLKRALAINQKKDNRINLAMNFGNLGIVYMAQGKLEKAIEAHQQSLSISEEENLVYDLARGYHNIGSAYFDLAKYSEAEASFLKSTQLCRSNQIGYGLMMNHLSLAALYKAQNKLDAAQQMADSALLMAQNFGDLKSQTEAYKHLSVIKEKKGNTAQALKYLQLFVELNDSLMARTNREQIFEIQERYESEKKDIENDLLKQGLENKTKTIQLQKVITLIISVALLAGLVLLILIFHSRHKVKKYAQQLEKLNHEKDLHNQQLNELNKTKDILFSIIGHDLRNPFNTLLGFLQLVIEGYDDMTPEERVEILKQLYAHSNNTYALLENLLQWAMSQRGQITYNPQNLNAHQLIEHELSFLKSFLDTKKITAENRLAPQTAISGDKDMLLTIFRNLMNNAIKYTEAGGNIIVGSEAKPGGLEISITDSGVGMAKETIAKLMGNDEIVSMRGTQNEKGSGLGLLIVKEFLKHHNGSLSIESEPNKGSRFNIFIPNATE